VLRIATWNVNSLKARLPRVEEWIGYARPDVLCLQETKLTDQTFPAMDFERLGYEWAHHGEGRWNGVAILSRIGLSDVRLGFDDGLDDERTEARTITAKCGDVQVTSVYVPNGRSLDNEMYQWKLHWLERLHDFLARNNEPTDALVVTGDFNIAPTDRDVYAPAKFVGQTHVSDDERKRLQAIMDWGLRDAFREQYGDTSHLFTWWDYRQGNFHKGLGMRIDLMLMTAPLADRVQFALMDRNARKGKLPSDHAPLFVDVNRF
jgi:exodeoxyribonuclease III